MMKDAPKSKKMLVAFDPEKSDKASSDFLVPVMEDGKLVFFGTRSRRAVAKGMVVFVGREITVNDVFARLVDSGRKIPVVTEALNVISNYLSQIGDLKIGQVVQISGNASQSSFTLEPAKVEKPVSKRSLP
jgi:hypothetical protein